MKDVMKIADSIEGWLSPNEKTFLYNVAKNCSGKGVIVEIGSWKGKSTVLLAKGSEAGKRIAVHSIDPHTGSPEHIKRYGKVNTFNEFNRNIKKAGVASIVKPLRKTSEHAHDNWKHPIELLWVDGSHEYDMVLLDFQLWEPNLVSGGVIAFHDTTLHEGTRKFIQNNFFQSKNFTGIRLLDSIIYAKKVDHLTFSQKMGNYVQRVRFRTHIFIDSLPYPIRKVGVFLFGKRKNPIV
ncbi:MAG: class I SAM-dependent methyltransferase [Candidatus Aenigmarchaeota archaeon]|nr:class I SAM-dependent methyltransferase [Candidatus Aenigmarchaeota archaeon]